MVDKFLCMLAALGFALFSFALPASAQDTMRIRGIVERIEGPVFVVKTRGGSEVKLTVTDSPLYVCDRPGQNERYQVRDVRRLCGNDAGGR